MIHAAYILSAYSNLKFLSLDQLVQVGSNMDDPNPIPSFDENLLINLCTDAKKVFEKEKNILEIDGDAIIVGDIHGSYHDLLRILNYIEQNPSKVIFLGDYVDRGCFSLECITLLFALKIRFPNRYFLLRGNHEFEVLCSQYGFKKEILNFHNQNKVDQNNTDQICQHVHEINDLDFDYDEEEQEEQVPIETLCDNYFANHININCYKYSETLYKAFMKAFSYIPIAAVVNKTSLCIHGGLSPLLDKIDKINKLIQRPIDDYDKNNLLCDILWSDPSSQNTNFFESNSRGRGHYFNGVITINFLKNNNLQRIIRGHECVYNGVDFTFNEKCITVFSASSYDPDMDNKSGILKIYKKKDRIEPVSFDPLPRLKKFDAVYYKVSSFVEEKTTKPVFSQFNIKSIKSCGFLPEPLNKSARLNDSSSNDKEESDSDMNQIVSSIPITKSIPTSRAIRSNSSNFKGGFLGPTISFNTGAQHRKSQTCYISPATRISCLNQLRMKNPTFGSDDGDSNFQPNVRLPMLSAKATI